MSKTDSKKRANSILSQRVWQGNREYTVHGVGTLTLYPEKASAEVRAYAMGHGFDQRIRDAAALSVNRDTGKSATPQEKYDAMKRLVDHYNTGTAEWSLKPAASGGFDAGLIILAMARALSKTLDEVEAVLVSTIGKRGVTDRAGALRLWADSKQVAAAVLTIKTERLAKDTDSDDLYNEVMAELDEGGGEDSGEDEDDDEAPM